MSIILYNVPMTCVNHPLMIHNVLKENIDINCQCLQWLSSDQQLITKQAVLSTFDLTHSKETE